jgi:glycosyltransferase involved in cell wall biosynthesis
MKKMAVLIPAYNPSAELVHVVRQLAGSDFAAIIVVNDGSSGDCDAIFREIEKTEKVTLLRHAVNLGKGAALKTGMNHVYCYFGDHIGLVTMDADGQHLSDDALRVAHNLEKNPDRLVIGARAFDGNVPFRSKIGNSVTRYLFKFLIGQKLIDVQSGLRGIPMAFIPVLLKIGSTGYEFELDMLLASKHAGCPVIEQPIRAIYIDDNRSSHFNPFIDSMKIYFVLFRFTLASLLSAVIDSSVFMIAYGFTPSILTSQALARVVSMIFNYSAVKQAVFYSKQPHGKTFPRYVLLVVISGFVSYILIRVLTTFSPLSVLAAKLTAESLVFLANFAIQRDFIFISSKKG